MPFEIKKISKLSFPCVSRTLRTLKERGLVELEELEEQRFRLYSLTQKGLMLKEFLEKGEV